MNPMLNIQYSSKNLLKPNLPRGFKNISQNCQQCIKYSNGCVMLQNGIR